MLLNLLIRLHFNFRLRINSFQSTRSQQQHRQQRQRKSSIANLPDFFFTPALLEHQSSPINMTDLPSSTLSKVEELRENEQRRTSYDLVCRWHALCASEDDVNTEVVVEGVNITGKEKTRLLCAMDRRVLRQQTEYEDIGQDHDMPIPLWYARRRGSSCASSSSEASHASKGSVASADAGDGGFKPWTKSDEVVEEGDVWQFRRRRSTIELQPSKIGSIYNRKDERQVSTGTCNPQ